MTKKNVNLKTDNTYDYQSIYGLEYYKKFNDGLFELYEALDEVLDDDLDDDKRFNLAFEEEEYEEYEEYLNEKLEDDLFNHLYDIIVDESLSYNEWLAILNCYENHSSRFFIDYCIYEDYFDDFEDYSENDFENDLLYECIAEYLNCNL